MNFGKSIKKIYLNSNIEIHKSEPRNGSNTIPSNLNSNIEIHKFLQFLLHFYFLLNLNSNIEIHKLFFPL